MSISHSAKVVTICKIEIECTEDEAIKIHNGIMAALSMNHRSCAPDPKLAAPAPVIQHPELVKQVAKVFSI